MTISCANCEHWKKEKSEDYYVRAWDAARLGLGECKKAVMLSESTGFRKEGGVKPPERILPKDEDDDWLDGEPEPLIVELDSTRQMYVMDGSSYRATLYTKAEFFCAHHSPKAYKIKADPNAVIAIALRSAEQGDTALLGKIDKELKDN